MGVAALRNAPAVLSDGWEGVLLDDRYGREMIGENAGGQQASHAGSEDDGVFTVVAGHRDSFDIT